MSKNFYKILLILIIIFGFFVFQKVEARSCTITAKWSRDSIALGDTARAEAVFENCNFPKNEVFFQYFRDDKARIGPISLGKITKSPETKGEDRTFVKRFYVLYNLEGDWFFKVTLKDLDKNIQFGAKSSILKVASCSIIINFDAKPRKVSSANEFITLIGSIKDRNDKCGFGGNLEFFHGQNNSIKNFLTGIVKKGYSFNEQHQVQAQALGYSAGQDIKFFAKAEGKAGTGSFNEKFNITSGAVVVGVGEEPSSGIGTGTEEGGTGPGNGTGSARPGEDVKVSFKIENPLKTDSIVGLLNTLGRAIFNIAIPIAVIMILYSGVLWLTAGANPKNIQRAWTVFKYTIIGLTIVLIGKGFLTLIKSILEIK